MNLRVIQHQHRTKIFEWNKRIEKKNLIFDEIVENDDDDVIVMHFSNDVVVNDENKKNVSFFQTIKKLNFEKKNVNWNSVIFSIVWKNQRWKKRNQFYRLFVFSHAAFSFKNINCFAVQSSKRIIQSSRNVWKRWTICLMIFFRFQFKRLNARLTINSFTVISNSFHMNQIISFKYACERHFK